MHHEFDIRVYFEDTDAGGIVYYANYLRFMERARTEMMRALGYQSSTSFETLGWIFVVTGVNIAYKRPAKLDDVLCVQTAIKEVREKRLVFRQLINRNKKNICEADIELACMNSQGRGIVVPQEVLDKLSPYLVGKT